MSKESESIAELYRIFGPPKEKSLMGYLIAIGWIDAIRQTQEKAAWEGTTEKEQWKKLGHEAKFGELRDADQIREQKLKAKKPLEQP